MKTRKAVVLLLLAVGCAAAFILARSQSPEINAPKVEWEKHLESEQIREISRLVMDPGGRLFAVGTVASRRSNEDGLIAEVSSDGELLWRYQKTTAEQDPFTSARLTNSGELRVMNSIYDYGLLSDELITLSKDGKVINKKPVEIPRMTKEQRYFSSISDAIPDSRGNMVLLAEGTKPNNSRDYWYRVMKLDPKGGTVWNKKIDNVNAIELDSSGNTYVAAGCIRKLDTNGNELWQSRPYQNCPLDITSVKISNSGSLYVAGKCGNIIGPPPTPILKLRYSFIQSFIEKWKIRRYQAQINGSGFYNCFVAKYDTNGRLIWTKIMETPSTDGVSAIAVDNKENLYIVSRNEYIPGGGGGGFASIGEIHNDPIFTAKFTSAGKLQWKKTLNAKYRLNSIAADNFGNVYITGSANKNAKQALGWLPEGLIMKLKQ